jgi:hypothetical protein
METTNLLILIFLQLSIYNISLILTFTCYNGGTPSRNGKCLCHAAYEGNDCAIVNCTKEPAYCQNTNFFTKTDCVNKNVQIFCPKLCDRCSGNKTEKSCTSSTVKLQCRNQGTYSKEYCACFCQPAFEGSECETLNCSLQPPICENEKIFNKDDCINENIKYFCPRLCGLNCDLIASTVVTTYTQHTTSTVHDSTSTVHDSTSTEHASTSKEHASTSKEHDSTSKVHDSTSGNSFTSEVLISDTTRTNKISALLIKA